MAIYGYLRIRLTGINIIETVGEHHSLTTINSDRDISQSGRKTTVLLIRVQNYSPPNQGAEL